MDQVDITGFDARSDSDTPFEYELTHGDGFTKTGVTLKLLGKHSDAATRFQDQLINKMLIEQEIAKRNGEPVAPRSTEAIRSTNIEAALVRVVGWSGVKQDYSKPLMRAALSRNPHWIDQIMKETDNLGNYLKGSSAPSSDSLPSDSD